ncbi:MCP four helix bundle domain-containing protein [Clostridium estertheticum]|nr:MCP four helix bundle domain-containing protein [Clostridium estertheticum]MBW9150740.1 MCP four helix bundle domain-containing protein [Clostridium estertheticum]WLC84527.1 hypothetical protein KTC97_01565 [Clostridium estertheticum]
MNNIKIRTKLIIITSIMTVALFILGLFSIQGGRTATNDMNKIYNNSNW